MPLDRVLWVVLEGALLAAVVAVLCRLFPRLRAAHRAFLWWLVSAKLLVGLLPLPAVHVAALPAPKPVAAAAHATEAPSGLAMSSPAMRGPSRAVFAGSVWLAGVALLGLGAVPGWLRVRRWVRTGREIHDAAWRDAVARASRAAGLRTPPRVLVVPSLETPLVTGWFRPAVLLPVAARERLRPDELEMTLAHEMAHVARGDLWLGLVPALARRLFFFHPAAWIAEREYAVLREAACDEIVLARGGADAFAYGRLLLKVATRRSEAAAIPMSRHSMLRRRLAMIDSVVRTVPIGRAGWALVALAALAIVPVRLHAKTAVDQRCLDIGSDEDNAYIITDGHSHTMCGDMPDIRLADDQRRHGEDVIWFRVGDQAWVVHDPAVVAKGRQLFAGVAAVGVRQAEVGSKQSRIGAEQSKIGMVQGEIGMRQAEVALQQAGVEMRRAEKQRVQDQIQQEAQREDAERLARELAERDAESSQLKRKTQDARSADEIEERMSELGKRMEALAAEQAAFGDQQRILGERMEREVTEAQRALSDLLERSMRDGTAIKVD